MSRARREKKRERREMAARAADALIGEMFRRACAQYERLLIEGSVEFDLPDNHFGRSIVAELQAIR